MMDFRLTETLRGMDEDELLKELAATAQRVGKSTLSMQEYNDHGKGHASTFGRRFGSWSKALELAGLQPSRSKIGITDEELFDNLKEVWINFGRQPKYLEMRTPTSRFSAGTYDYRFGSWRKALFAFLVWVEAAPDLETPDTQLDNAGGNLNKASGNSLIRRTKRDPTEKQRIRILMRDGFSCQSCGAAPHLTRGVELHLDHVVPWSKGGETVDDNLITKCKRCNLGKGNMIEKLGPSSH